MRPPPVNIDEANDAIARAERELRSCRQPQALINIRAQIALARANIAAIAQGLNQGAELADHRQAIAQMIEACRNLDKIDAEYRATCRGDAIIGMTAPEIQRTRWCWPDRINRTITAGHETEQWVYLPLKYPTASYPRPVGYLYLTDGVLTGIQTSY